MSRYVEAETLVRWICRNKCGCERDECGYDIPCQQVQLLEGAPSIDINRPQGEWIYGEHNVAMCDGYRCNRCDFFVPWDYEHKFIDFINDYHYCPNCGAKMKGADDEV